MKPLETCALPKPPGRENVPEEAEPLPEGFSALLRQIGLPEALLEGPGLLPPDGIHAGNSLRDFLEGYQTQVLAPLELPAIARARRHAARGHLRELIALDRELDGQTLLPAFASASRRIGRAQLERLRPLRDERIVQRYLAAVEAGDAAGWHTVVYGITLAVYSWPLRQGLLTYARETLSGLALAAGRPAGFTEPACLEILQDLFLRLPAAIEETLAACEEEEKKPERLLPKQVFP
jgi:urease accessory protein UreF